MPDRPLISVVVPTYARGESLRACLAGFAGVRPPRGGFEVVVSDDGSPASPQAVVDAFRDRISLTMVHGPNRGPAAARNRGAAGARGTYLLFVDDDCIPAPDLLTALERRFAAAPDALIGGGIDNALPDDPFATATQLIVSYVYEHFERSRAEFRFFNTSNLAVPARAFHRLGGFSEAFPLPAGEDYDFCHRWQHAGGATLYAPEALVRHAHPLTLGGFCLQHFRYGRGLLLCRLRIAQRSARPMRGEAPSFYLNLLRYPLTRPAGRRRWAHAALVVLSQAATAAGAAWQGLAQARPRRGAAGAFPDGAREAGSS